jgi:hypothetical protein
MNTEKGVSVFNFKLLLSFILIAFLFGCNGKRVVDNVYNPPGCQAYIISSDMAYVGSPAVKASGGCSGVDCSLYGTSGGKMTSDMFVGSKDNVLQEVVVLQRSQTPQYHYWPAVEGNKVEFGGKEFVEDFFIVDGTKEDAYYYAIKQAGYTFDGTPVGIRVLCRNLNKTTRLYIFYGISESLLPADVKDNEEAEKEFVRKKFAECISVPQ